MRKILFLGFIFLFVIEVTGNDLGAIEANPLQMPAVADYGLRILSPTLLELTLITTKRPDPAPITEWNFVGANGQLSAPAPSAFVVTAGGQTIAVQSVGFKRRALYAPLKIYDLRMGNYLYLQLANPIPEGQTVEVKNPDGKLWRAKKFSASGDSLRWSPVIHVNQEGYLPEYPKKAMVGYYLGSLGEMKISAASGFKLLDANNNAVVYTNILTSRKDIGYTYTMIPYQ
ncbi:MAG: cellulase N-terminal Ig-like domain-containing protein, partial [Limisphaerales bacterium]